MRRGRPSQGRQPPLADRTTSPSRGGRDDSRLRLRITGREVIPAYSSELVKMTRPQASFSSRDSERSARMRPPVWQRGQ